MARIGYEKLQAAPDLHGENIMEFASMEYVQRPSDIERSVQGPSSPAAVR